MLALPHLSRHAAAVAAAALLFGFAQGPDPRLERGRALFDKPFRPSEGVGAPEMNADSCRACHQDPGLGGAGGLELNVTRFGRDNGGAGPFTDLPGGQLLSKLRAPNAPGREEPPTGAMAPDVFEQRQTPSIFGDGLIDGIPDAVILANEDPNDANGDGIYGVARRIEIQGVVEIGRFGWKAQVPRLADFVRDAMFGELGITTPSDGRGFGQETDDDAIPDPELTQAEIDDVAFFMSQLPAPRRKMAIDGLVAQGEQVFLDVGCARCHVPSLLGAEGPVPLYSNLLLHDVMPSNYRGMAEPGAGAGMFRTPPLWGISDTAPYMHDGRAENLLQAIEAHRGEAEGVRNAFLSRSPVERAALIAFLEDL